MCAYVCGGCAYLARTPIYVYNFYSFPIVGTTHLNGVSYWKHPSLISQLTIPTSLVFSLLEKAFYSHANDMKDQEKGKHCPCNPCKAPNDTALLRKYLVLLFWLSRARLVRFHSLQRYPGGFHSVRRTPDFKETQEAVAFCFKDCWNWWKYCDTKNESKRP